MWLVRLQGSLDSNTVEQWSTIGTEKRGCKRRMRRAEAVHQSVGSWHKSTTAQEHLRPAISPPLASQCPSCRTRRGSGFGPPPRTPAAVRPPRPAPSPSRPARAHPWTPGGAAGGGKPGSLSVPSPLIQVSCAAAAFGTATRTGSTRAPGRAQPPPPPRRTTLPSLRAVPAWKTFAVVTASRFSMGLPLA